MNQEFIDKALDIMDIKLKEEEKKLVNFVNMRECAVASEEKPLLLTVGLQSCIGLIGWCENFSFLAHMNMCTCESDFYVDEEGKPTKCKKIEQLYKEILKNKEKIKNIINIGLVLGVAPLEESTLNRKILENDLLELFQKLRMKNINSIRLPNLSAFSFVLDSRNGDIILEDNKKIQIPEISVIDKNEKNLKELDRE